MTRYADPHACPGCTSPVPEGARTCAHCGIDLSDDLAQELFATLTAADQLLARMQARRDNRGGVTGGPTAWNPAATAGTPTSAPTGVAVSTSAPTGAAAAVSTAASTSASEQGLRASAVPKILLAVGATCLLAAAVVFLVVTWSSLGVGGRTAILVGFTVAMAALTRWSARRGFRGAVETLGLVSIGLLALDLVGAESAGWFGSPSEAAFTLGCGLVLLAVGVLASWASRRTPAGPFAGAEVVAILSSLVALVAAAGLSPDAPVLPLALILLALGGAVVLAHLLGVRVAAVGIGSVAALGWLALLMTAVGEASRDGEFTLSSVWAEGGVVGLVVTAALATLVAVPPPVPQGLRSAAAAAAAVALVAPLLLPAVDDDVRVTTALAVVVTLLASAAVTRLLQVSRGWAPSPLGLLGIGAATLGLESLGWLMRAVEGYSRTASSAWSGTPGGRVAAPTPPAWVDHAWMLPAAVLTLALASLACGRLLALPAPGHRRAAPVLAVLTLGSVPLAMLGHRVPVWSVLLVLLLGAGLAAAPVLRPSAPGRPVGRLAVAAGLLAVAQPLSWYDETLTAVTLLATLALLATTHLVSRHVLVAAVAGAAGVASLAGLVWTLGALSDRPEPLTALMATGAVGLVALARGSLGRGSLGRDTRDRPPVGGVARAAVEAAAAVVAAPLLVLGAAAADRPATWAAVHLTVLGGATVALSLLRPDRRQVAAIGVLLLAAATWLRLGDLGVSEPEPYTLPSAVLLTLVGLWQLRRRPGLSTRSALGPGLTLALVPSLLWILADDDTDLRVLLLGLGCLGLVLAGASLRWSAPLVLGAAVGAVVAVGESAPYVDAAVPRWALLALAGAVLVVVALTWESRMADARRASAYLGRLR